MNNKINRYKIGLSIINNNGGLIAMLNKIYTKCYKMLENVLEWVAYNYIGYKEEIFDNYKDIKALKKEIKELKELINKHINLTN
tara:strand:+ start:497 stop:748 length:252 start_codon:yes stop_codon:yes gene_type:complete